MITNKDYIEANLRLETLLKIVDDEGENEALNNELILVSDIIEAYEEKHHPIGMPKLMDVIELRMFEMKLKQKDLAVLLGTSASRISEIFKGKRDITLSLARSLHKKLNIDSDIILQ
ncbi:helix-turn-helix domain-containing protein [Pseudotamlana carrageenivorans]|uniref:Transcriptional regulator n=1 Tax=Pseudotamlana carrageenivorans TaxID=2069432 RepID=A0A2I7SML6_9FLAO|nr:helix-turn-helix domain-containing protein [Tamlana carrageenivorans]AUS07146.1 transcriptional regulator [Tamlana carrageenivorans]